MSHDLESMALALVADGKGILAADESVSTLTKRFDALGIPSTAETRRTYDETIRQKSAAGTRLAQVLSSQGMVPGIKVDIGAKRLAGSPDETITEGLDGLRDRLAE